MNNDIRKNFSRLLTVVMLFSVMFPCILCFSSCAKTFIRGDVNGDNTVDSSDATAILRHDAGMTELTKAQISAADANKDGEADSADASDILKYDAGITTEVGGDTGKKVLVAYFSRTGNTAPIAEYIASALDADIYEIEAEIPYTDDDIKYYTDCRADREQNDPSARPAIAKPLPDLKCYSTVFIGYPIWHAQAPRIIYTFLESGDFSGKALIPFCTSASSPIGSSAASLHSLTDGASWLDGIRFAAGTPEASVKAWLKTIGLLRDDARMKIFLTAGGKEFEAILTESDTAAAFFDMLPASLDMKELNGNEKYCYLSRSLPSQPQSVGRIEAGDIMLYGDNCIVVFYESFDTSYSYTRIGRITDITGLKEALGKVNVKAEFEK